MEGDQFSLCWNNYSNNLRSGFHSLLKDEDLVDVTLAAEGHYLKAHKAVLSICSPYLKELFRANPGDHPIVILPDVNYSALQSLLEFMYQGEVSVSQDEIPAFMKVAETLKVKGLTENENNRDDSPTNTNGINDRNSPFLYGNLDTKITSITKSPVKKIIKPIEALRYTDSPKMGKISPSLKSPSSSSSPHQQPLKKIKPQIPVDMLINPKEEPMDEIPENEEYDENLDMSAMLDTTISEPGRSSESWVPDYKFSTDTSSPGTLQCVLGKRGNPRLIVDSHTFYKKSTYKGKSFWYCKHNRTPFKCPAVCWTLNGHIVKWPTNHSHVPIPEPFNPDEDMEVPIDRLQEVLMHYGW
ncbi:zinc finger and BTB domain-containing protein 17-like isoform X1 [Photinus pyralis]|uniref:BTB domain-containing protein n=1 Tax=Photinus pyralis TaxID=7054 RepID=A0A1Y1L877_PHOPY|nr:zinc finger and BTB domain-containing protein 17-like isoform X1 [Photinus pyralis]XP_031332247.1 zinc finger and BTB domain-containing protein 17-like isoform X1 [Photinus pyralis]